jgi:hypothetical protein
MLDTEPGYSLMMMYRPMSLTDANTSSKMFLINSNLDRNGNKIVTAVNANFSLIFKYLTEKIFTVPYIYVI